jgi:hypothetical protein
MFYFALVLLVASYAISALTTKKTPTPTPAAITSFQFPQSAEGTPQAVLFGDCWMTDYQVLWYGNYRTSKIRSTGAKKGT